MRFPSEPLLRLAGNDAFATMDPSENPFDARPQLGERGLRRGPE